MLKDKLKDNIFIATVIALNYCILYSQSTWVNTLCGYDYAYCNSKQQTEQKHKAFLNIAYFCNFCRCCLLF